MSRIRAILTALLALASALPATADSLPSSWHGVWAGDCATVQPGAPPTTFGMKLEVEPDQARKTDGLNWITTFHTEGLPDVKKAYRLEPTEYPGRFLMTEPNGIVLDTTRVHNSIYQLYFMPDNKLQVGVRFTRTAEGIDTEITTYTTARPRAHEVPGMTRVVGFQLMSVQRCELVGMGQQR